VTPASPLRIGSLFAGIGGFDLAARWMGWETAWYSEIDPYCCAVMAKHFPDALSLGDITKVDWSTVERPDLLCGGFPCQDISNAGKRAGIDGERSGLWSEFARAIRELRPRYVVVENVAALLGRGMGRVLGDLAALGYDAEWTVLSAADVGAPHLRERIWIVAYPDCGGRGGSPVLCQQSGRAEAVRYGKAASVRDAAHHASHGAGIRQDEPFGNWRTEPNVGRVAHGVPSRTHRLRGLGNAIVPQCAYEIFSAIQASERVA
jgi:DNA (cytosine-5)-methyltransferase 1